jgi:chemotaxis protein methyltransferase CheR
MDLIICRNVLMYFNSLHANRVVENLHRSLVDEGWLVVSSVEVSHSLFSGFSSINLNEMTFYRKTKVPMKHFQEYHSSKSTFMENRVDYTDLSNNETEAVSTSGTSVVDNESARQPEDISPLIKKPAKDDINPCEKAYVLFQKGFYDEAVEIINRLLSEQPQNTEAVRLLARIRANQGRLKEALECCTRGIRIDKLNAGCYYLLAAIQQELGLIDDSILSFKRALYINPNLVLAYFALGNLARIQGKINESEKYFANALASLHKCQPDDMLPESEGMAAGRLREIINIITTREEAA